MQSTNRRLAPSRGLSPRVVGLCALFFLAAGAMAAHALTPVAPEKICSRLRGAPADDCAVAISGKYVDASAAAVCDRLRGPAFVIACARSIVDKRYTAEELDDCNGLESPWETIQCLAASGRPGRVAGCNTYGCWTDPGGSCNTYGCWSSGGGCTANGCWRSGGGCNTYGCWSSGGGCTANGCWRSGGGCNTYGCWNAPTGKCNTYGCSDFGECTTYGCPK